MTKHLKCIAIGLGALATFSSSYGTTNTETDFDTKFKPLLEKYSIRTDSVINDYYAGGLIGNGFLGATIYKTPGDTLCWELGRTDVCDHRKEAYSDLYNSCRLPIGKFLLPMQGGKSSMKTDFYRSEVSGVIQNNRHNEIAWRTLSPAANNVYMIELRGNELPDLIFQPDLSASPRFTYNNQSHAKMDKVTGYVPNPTPKQYTQDGYSICKQPMLAGGEYTTVWTTRSSKGKKLLIASVAYSQTRTDTEKDAIRDIEAILSNSVEKAEKMHLKWWHDFYSKSYVHVSEDRYNAFFWSQLYKLGSATRSNRLPIDLMGPWFYNNTPWPAIWWNLNIQLTYSPMFAINHNELVKPLLDMLDNNIENLKQNVPADCPYPAVAIGRTSTYDCRREVGKEHGLLLWTMLYYWKYCTYTNDNARLKEKMFPLLKLAVNYYRYLLKEGEDGYLHLPKSHSPEYGDAEDCNFELSILRWGCEALVKIDQKFSIHDPLLPEWKRILDKLVPYPADQDGFMIGKDVKLTSGHRHYSHLLMLYPLQNFPLDTDENIELANRSINYWLGFKNGYYVGYTYTGCSSMATLLGDGDRAYNYLNVFFDKYLQPNTLYKEAGPCFETPTSALSSFMEMLVYSHDDVIRILPAIPSAWKDVKFDNLLAEGGFEISAERKNGQTEIITIKSLYGGDCTVYCDIPAEARDIRLKGKATAKACERNALQLSIPKGEEIVICRKGI